MASLHNLFVVKHEKVKNNFIHVIIDRVCNTSGCCPAFLKRKTSYIIVNKDLFDPSCIASIDLFCMISLW